MAKGTAERKAIKDIGWSFISLTAKEFKGATQTFKADNGSLVAVCFGMTDAFIIEDAQGLFGVEDLKQGVIKAKHIDVESPGQIDGAIVIAWGEAGEVEFAEGELDRLGINDFSVRESITNRLKALGVLNTMVDVPLG